MAEATPGNRNNGKSIGIATPSKNHSLRSDVSGRVIALFAGCCGCSLFTGWRIPSSPSSLRLSVCSATPFGHSTSSFDNSSGIVYSHDGDRLCVCVCVSQGYLCVCARILFIAQKQDYTAKKQAIANTLDLVFDFKFDIICFFLKRAVTFDCLGFSRLVRTLYKFISVQ